MSSTQTKYINHSGTAINRNRKRACQKEVQSLTAKCTYLRSNKRLRNSRYFNLVTKASVKQKFDLFYRFVWSDELLSFWIRVDKQESSRSGERLLLFRWVEPNLIGSPAGQFKTWVEEDRKVNIRFPFRVGILICVLENEVPQRDCKNVSFEECGWDGLVEF
ncbi:hypothetical protein TNCV_4690741 [Trichonephila clavipes]|nr:hypothetical protein TNCV_4690741 [Trichonephila clavipes]